ncbi:MAG: FAD-dependent monooxygenase [Gammaproteobacteria bacterium]
MSAELERASCCVVGSGPVRAVLSLLLARNGVPVTLLEGRKDFDREFHLASLGHGDHG